MGITPGELDSSWGVGETTNQKAVLGMRKTPGEPESRWGFGETTNKKEVLGSVKPQENRKASGVWGKDQPEGGFRGG